MSPIDGRTLRRDLNRFFKNRFPGLDPHYSVETKWEDWVPYLIVYLHDADEEVHDETVKFSEGWFKENRKHLKPTKKEYVSVRGKKFPLWDHSAYVKEVRVNTYWGEM